jgi:poly(3-hydroxybutyrate) depolymerase
VEPARVGIAGWSHGGSIALMAAFDHPDKFHAACAGVPVSDLVACTNDRDVDVVEVLARESRTEIYRFLARHPKK